VAQVDGGNGHSGRRSPDIHFGLGGVEKTTLLPVEIQWRNKGGKVQQRTLQLVPGWHSIQLQNTDAVVVHDFSSAPNTAETAMHSAITTSPGDRVSQLQAQP
jgi:hypothetical protein